MAYQQQQSPAPQQFHEQQQYHQQYAPQHPQQVPQQYAPQQVHQYDGQQALHAQQPQQVQQFHTQGVPQSQQYQATAPMQATLAQVGQPKGWQNGLMDCGPCESCLLGTCLPCILLGKTSERMRDQTLQTYDTFNTDCLLMCGIQYVTGCGWIYVMMKRSEIREKFGIEGDGTSDYCVSYWCACCALIQQDKEVEARMPPGNVTAQGYQPQAGMQMPAPAHHATGKN